MRTRDNIHQHEFIGLDVEVVASPDRSQIGTRGKIVDETRNTLTVETEGTDGKGMKEMKERMVPKAGSTFRLRLGDETADVEGDRITFRPEDRIKKCAGRMRKQESTALQGGVGYKRKEGSLLQQGGGRGERDGEGSR